MLFLEQANFVTALDQVVWDTSWLLSDTSVIGRALHTLIGYTEKPTAMQVIAYLVVLAVMFLLMRLLAPRPEHAAAQAAE